MLSSPAAMLCCGAIHRQVAFWFRLFGGGNFPNQQALGELQQTVVVLAGGNRRVGRKNGGTGELAKAAASRTGSKTEAL